MRYLAIIPVVLLSACESPSLQGLFTPVGVPVDVTVPPETLDPTPPPPPPTNARTVEQFDTTTAEDRAAAVAAPVEPAGEERLGITNVSLGSPADPGIWLKTPLVNDLREGRVVYPLTDKSVNIELRPSGGAEGSASQMSLAAMRLLEIPLTALADVEVFGN